MSHTITIVGSSARAAAFSAAAAGLSVYAGDLFADSDLRRVASVTQVSDYPAGLARVIDGEQPGPWLYTGALENHPELIESWASRRTLAGNPSKVLRAVRDPVRLTDVCRRNGLHYPPTSCNPPSIGNWLVKPLQSGGGTGIHRWHAQLRQPGDESPKNHVYQQLVAGTAYSGAYVANGRTAVLLGVTEQLVGCDWTGASGYRYCGSIGPAILSADEHRQFTLIGDTLALEFGLKGLFGVDVVINKSGVVWVIEVNPRYTASMEVLERLHTDSFIAIHLAACFGGPLPPPMQLSSANFVGKAVVFARSNWKVPAKLERSFSDRDPCVQWHDVPATDARIEAGWPIATVLVTADSPRTVLSHLHREAAWLHQFAANCPAASSAAAR